jgi:inositol hexakisphosphate/diphosphoinositol-pentakisphosphate kinase
MVTVGAGEAGGGSRANQSPGSGSKQRATKGRERKSASLGHSWTGQVVNWRGTLAREDGIITLGICAMDKKASSKHMHAIMSRMDKKRFTVVLFGDDCILNKPVDKWPLCDVLIAFFSDGFPLDKAEQYVALRKPYSLNDLGMQRDMQDRRLVYAKLREAGVPIPKNVCVSRDNDNGDDENTLEEFDDHIVVNDVVINKPFVEKPVDADDHNIYIYYPMSAGGGSKRLFRKVQNRSSDFFADVNEVRRDGSYIYEEFVETQGTDVKVRSCAGADLLRQHALQLTPGPLAAGLHCWP